MRIGSHRRWAPRLCLSLALCWPVVAGAQQVSEYQVKAAYLFHFLNFVDWPQRAFRDAAAPFEICAIGTDPFGSDLDNTVAGKQVRGRSVRVRRLAGTPPAKDCHILFIAASERARVSWILDAVAGRPLLTVSELPEFEEQGGMIRFVVEQESVRLRINPKAVQGAGLQASSKLLAIATLTRKPEGGGR